MVLWTLSPIPMWDITILNPNVFDKNTIDKNISEFMSIFI